MNETLHPCIVCCQEFSTTGIDCVKGEVVKNAGMISVFSVPMAMFICIILMCLMDTSGFAALGAAFLCTAIVFFAGVVGIIFGILEMNTGKSRALGIIGVILGLIVVGGGIGLVLYCYLASGA